jgi:hypothetical protein
VSVCVFIPVRGIEGFIVLVGVEAVVERLRLDSDVREQLKEAEANIHSLKAKLAKLSTGADTVPINAYATLGESNTGAT